MKIETSYLCKKDYIKIIDKDGTELLPRICGFTNLPPVITSFNDWVQVIFHTDSNSRLEGWKLNWTEGKNDFPLQFIWKFQPSEMRPTQGVLKSPDYPKSYKNNLDNTYGIQVTQGMVIRILFSELMLDSHTPCRDYINVLDGNDEDILLDSTCGSKLPARIQSVTHRVNIIFHSDHSSPARERRRWMITWNESKFLNSF